MNESFRPRQIDEVVIVSEQISDLIQMLKDGFCHKEWTFHTRHDNNGNVLWHEAVHVMSGRKAFRVIQPVDCDTPFYRHLARFGKGIFGARESVPDAYFDAFIDHLASKDVMLSEMDGVVWADFTKEFGGWFGFIRASESDHPLTEGPNLHQFCLAVKDLRRAAEILCDTLLLGPTEIGNGNLKTIPNARSAAWPDGLPDFSFLVGMIFYDNMEFEIIQPISGPLPYFSFLRDRDAGFHHIKVDLTAETWQPTLDRLDALGISDGFQGKLGTCQFSNRSTEEQLGFMYEFSDGAPMEALPEGYAPFFYPE